MSTSESKMVVLKSSDNEIFQVEEAVAFESQTIKHLFEDDYVNVIPLPNVKSEVLSKVIEYCRRHVDKATEYDLNTFDKEFVKVDQQMVFDLIMAAYDLKIKKLLDMMCQVVADMIKACTPDEMLRSVYCKANNFTTEEEEEVRAQNAWAPRTPAFE